MHYAHQYRIFFDHKHHSQQLSDCKDVALRSYHGNSALPLCKYRRRTRSWHEAQARKGLQSRLGAAGGIFCLADSIHNISYRSRVYHYTSQLP